MKRIQIIIITFLLSGLVNYTNAQERLQSIEKGISLVGCDKSILKAYITSLGFRFNNQTRSGDMVEYSKVSQYGHSAFGFAGNNKKANTISWTEDSSFGQDVLSEIRDKSFQISLQTIGDDENTAIKAFTCYNYSRNILINLIFRPGESFFHINIGKIDGSKPIERTNNNEAPASRMPLSIKRTPTNDVEMIETKPFLVKSQKAYFFNLNNDVVTQRKAYLVKGEEITALNEKKSYVYCEFTNSTTNKTSKGWILKSCLATIKDNITTSSPVDVAMVVSINTQRKLTNNDFDTYTGIIQSVDKVKDENGNIDFWVYCKDESGGYNSVYVTTSYFIPEGYSNETISATDSAKFKQIIKPGRRIEFHVISEGSGVLKHLELIYIKALPKASIIVKNPIVVDSYLGINTY